LCEEMYHWHSVYESEHLESTNQDIAVRARRTGCSELCLHNAPSPKEGEVHSFVDHTVRQSCDFLSEHIVDGQRYMHGVRDGVLDDRVGIERIRIILLDGKPLGSCDRYKRKTPLAQVPAKLVVSIAAKARKSRSVKSGPSPEVVGSVHGLRNVILSASGPLQG
jgi:hypothetical protein